MSAPRLTPVLCLPVLLAASLALAQVDKAERALKDLEYGAALKALETARRQVGNDRATVVRVLELQAVTLAAMGQEAKALKAFQQLLVLVPDFKLTGNHPPRVTTALYEARGWLDANQPLAGKARAATQAAAGVTEVGVELTNDPLKLVKEVRFHLDVDGAASDVDVGLEGAGATAKVSGRRVAWWAELLGEQKAALLAIGSSAAPRVDAVEAPKPVAASEPEVKPDPRPTPADEAPVISEWSEPPRPMPPGRVLGLVAGGAGVVCAGVGVAFGVMANATRAQVTGAQADAAGRITSLTQKEALALDAQQRTQATLANVFLVSGGVLAAGGVTLFLVTRDDVQVTLSPVPGGGVLSGRF